MGILISAEQVSQAWPHKQVLAGQSIGIFEGDCIGIVGNNGDGKSTLLSILAGKLQPDSGQIVYRGGISISYLAQADELDDNATVEEVIAQGRPRFEWAKDLELRRLMEALLAGVELSSRVRELSGGQRRRLDLLQKLAAKSGILLLDEPTNHLDLAAIYWLAGYLKEHFHNKNKALLLVSHDRWFLDEVTLAMWEVHDGQIESFEGGYSAYIQQRLERQRIADLHEERRQNILRKELNWLAHGAQARTSKPKFRIDAALNMLADEPPARNTIELKRMAVSRLGKQVFEIKDLSFSYPDETGERKTIISHLDWLIGPGERLAILGENGAGKSSLLSLLYGQLKPDSGVLKVGASVRFGILSQHLDLLAGKEDYSILELVKSYKSYIRIEDKSYSAEQMLERLGFERREFALRIADLSGGQKRRLSLMCVLLSEPNVLILDEPGNDLDTNMLAVLEDLLDSWPGTLLLVSHDRYLCERVCDDLFALIDGRIVHLPRGVDEYLERLTARPKAKKPVLAADTEAAAETRAADKLTNQQRRDLKKQFDATGRKINKLTEELAAEKAKLSTLDQSNYVELQAQSELIQAKADELDALELSWLELAETLNLEV